MKAFWLSGLVVVVFGCSQSERVDPWSELYAHYDDDFKTILANITQKTGKEIITYENLLPDTLTNKINVKGSQYDLGYQVGLIGQALGHELPIAPDKERNQAIIDMYSVIHPPYLEKVRGLAASYGRQIEDTDLIVLEYIYPRYLFWELFRYREFPSFEEIFNSRECSATSFYNGDLNFANKQMDGALEFPRFVVQADLEGVHRVITNTVYPIAHAMNDGMNDKGLFIGFAANASPEEFWEWGPQEYPDIPAISHTHAARIALEKCSNVAEVVAFFQSIRIYVPDRLRHFLIADAQGASIILEWDLETFEPIVFEREGLYQVMTNTSMQIGFDEVVKDCWRFSKANELFSQGVSNYEEYFEVVGAIQIPPELMAETIWSTVVDLHKLEMRVYPWELQNQAFYTFSF